MAGRIRISFHAIRRYRERTKKDHLRKKRTDEQIASIIINGITSHKSWPALEKLVEKGMNMAPKLNIDLYDSEGNYIGTHAVVLEKDRDRGRMYVVRTYI